MKKKNIWSVLQIIIAVGLMIGLICVVVISIQNINKKMRDTKRVNDMKSLSRAFDSIKKDVGNFDAVCGANSEFGLVSACVGEKQEYLLNHYLPMLGEANDPQEKVRACDEACSQTPCNYSFSALNATQYRINFYLELGAQGLGAGCHSLTQEGLK